MFGLTSSLAVVFLSATTGGIGLPFGVPPTPEDPALARALPYQCLFCLSWAGTASPDPKSANQTEQLLAEPEVQNFLKQIEHFAYYALQGDSKALQNSDGTAWGLGVLRNLATHPGVIFISNVKFTGKPDFSTIEGGLIFSLGKDLAMDSEKLFAPMLPDIVAMFRKQPEDNNKKGESRNDKTPDKSKGNKSSVKPTIGDIEAIKIDGVEWYRLPSAVDRPSIVFGIHENYFIVGVGKNAVENILERMKNGKTPKWWTAIGEQLPIERRSIAIYVDLQAAGKLAGAWLSSEQLAKERAILETIGLGNAASWIEVWGLDGKDFANKTLLTLDGEPSGLLKSVCDRSLKLEDLRPIPRDAAFGAAFRFNLQEALDGVLASLGIMGPETKAAANRQIDEWERLLGLNLRHGTLKSLGDTWRLYGSPSEGNYIFTGLTAVVPLQDWAGMNLAYGRLMGIAKRWSPNREEAPPHREEGNRDAARIMPIQSFRFADNDVYCFNDEQSALGAVGSLPMAWCMTKQEMVFALSPQNVKAYLSRDERYEPIGLCPQVAKLFSSGDGPAMIAYGDAQHAFEAFYPLVVIGGKSFVESLQAENPEITVSLLPSCSSVDRHLGPTVAALWRKKHGIEFVSRGTIPLPSAPFWFGWMVWQSCADAGAITARPVIVAPPQPVQTGAASHQSAVPPPQPMPSSTAPVPREVKPTEKTTPAEPKWSPSKPEKPSSTPKP